MRLFAVAAVVYLLAPGHPDVPLGGLPLGQLGTILLITIIGLWAWVRHAAPAPRATVTIMLAVVLAAKLAIAALVPASGWLGAYYANDRFEPPIERSLDYLDLGSTRIDRQLSFVDTEFPVHFFNDDRFNFGLRREATEPFSVHWRGFVHADGPVTLVREARGQVSVAVDGADQSSDRVAVPPGEHLVEVRYRKDKDVEGQLRVMPLDGSGAPRSWAVGEVMPSPQPAAARGRARVLVPVAWGLHLVALGLVLAGLGPAVLGKLRTSFAALASGPVEAAAHWVGPVVLTGLALQGLWKSRHLVDRVWTLTGGDDWLAFEMNAREILLNGPLMTFGAELGTVEPFFEYPGYGYFLALVHALTGESLAGVLLANFVMLALATLCVYGIARRVAGPHAAVAAVAWLLVLQQLDFVRYYTVTLLSENLFFFMAAVTIYLLIRFVEEGKWTWLVLGGLAGGLAAATRPTMMLFLPPAMVILAVARWRPDGAVRVIAAPVLLVVLWLAAISPFTLRNYLVSGEPVLITAGQARTFIDFNVPQGNQNAKYYQAFTGSMLSSATTLLWILWDHPAETLKNWGIKLGFSLGMVHWMGTGTPHPELLLTSVLYFAGIALLRQARTWTAWLIHAFVLTHLATMALSIPSNYGYRLLLPMYLLMPVVVGALLAAAVERWLARRAGDSRLATP